MTSSATPNNNITHIHLESVIDLGVGGAILCQLEAYTSWQAVRMA